MLQISNELFPACTSTWTPALFEHEELASHIEGVEGTNPCTELLEGVMQ